VCRLSGYCKSKKAGNKCRFGYPFKLENQTRIEFIESENSVKAEIYLKRNDSYMNMHNRSICHNWRGNVDLQIILDHRAAIDYMVKYATKSEKTGKPLQQIYHDIFSTCNDDDNPNTKVRSLMIHLIAGNRDLGQCEVSRLLFSDPLYHSTFTYVMQSSDLYNKGININEINNDSASATKVSMIDLFRYRKKNPLLIPHLLKITNLIEFFRLFKLVKKEPRLRDSVEFSSESVVVTMYPRIRFNPDNIEKYKEYCFHQIIRFSPWDDENYDEIKNVDSAIEDFKNSDTRVIGDYKVYNIYYIRFLIIIICVVST
jgi:hypothetical protein